MEAFQTQYKRTEQVENLLQFRDMTSGFVLLRIEKEEPRSVTALLQEADSDTVARAEFLLDADVAAAKPLKLDIKAIERPADMRMARRNRRDDKAATVTCLGCRRRPSRAQRCV